MSDNRLKYLFARYYEKTATSQEREELMDLLQRTENHPQLEQWIEAALHTDNEAHALPEEITRDILHAILKTGNTPIAASETRPPVHIPRPAFPWKPLLIAASLAGIALLGLYEWYAASDLPAIGAIQPTKYGADFLPGKEKARLSLFDGRVIDLEAVTHEDLAAYRGVTVDTARGELTYSSHSGEQGYNTVSTPLGGQYRVVLPDGSKVWLNAGSSLRFPSAFTGIRRQVEITGEAYFEILPDAAHPFVVKLPTKRNMEITVLGTHFNVSSYIDEPLIRTTLLTGSVEVKQGNTVRILSPGQQAQVPLSTGPIAVTNVDAEGVTAWKEGRFEFNGNIQDIMKQIARWYNLEIEYDGNASSKAFIGTISRHNNVSEVLQLLELTGGIKFEITGRKIIVKANS